MTSNDDIRHLKEALELTNQTLLGILGLVNDRMDRVERQFQNHDLLIQALIDSQQQGQAQLSQQIKALQQQLDNEP